jgi:hypothetical protein
LRFHLPKRRLLTVFRSQVSRAGDSGRNCRRERRHRRLQAGQAHADPKTGDTETLYECPRRWLAIDVDGIARPAEAPASDIAACAQVAIRHLPSEFQSRRCIAVATASHGIKPGCRLRLWFWLAGAATRKTLQAWFLDHPVDMAAFRPAQICYTAAPVFAGDVADPIPKRLVLLRGAPLVPIRPLPPPRPSPARSDPLPAGARADRYRDAALAAIATRLQGAGEGNRHGTLIAEACALFKLVATGCISDGYACRFIRDAAVTLNPKGERQIPSEEVDELLGWARERPT